MNMQLLCKTRVSLSRHRARLGETLSGIRRHGRLRDRPGGGTDAPRAFGLASPPSSRRALSLASQDSRKMSAAANVPSDRGSRRFGVAHLRCERAPPREVPGAGTVAVRGGPATPSSRVVEASGIGDRRSRGGARWNQPRGGARAHPKIERAGSTRPRCACVVARATSRRANRKDPRLSTRRSACVRRSPDPCVGARTKARSSRA